MTDIKRGTKLKLTNYGYVQQYYNNAGLSLGDIRYFDCYKPDTNKVFFHIMIKDGQRIKSESRKDIYCKLLEWTIIANEYGCKHACNPCAAKCDFWEEGE